MGSKKKLALGMMLFWTGGCGASLRAGVPLRPLSYQEGFEGPAHKVTLWATNGEAEVHFLGPSEEQACAGKRSLKLDATLKSGSFHYWGVAVPGPCAGKLKLSDRLRVAEGTIARVGFGPNFRFPPTSRTKCQALETFTQPTPGWQEIEGDLVARGNKIAASVMGDFAPTVRVEDIGVALEEDFQADLQSRWARGQDRFREQIQDWQKEIAVAEDALTPTAEPSRPLRAAIAKAQAKAAQARELIATLAPQGDASGPEMSRLEALRAGLRDAPETVAALTRGEAAGKPFLIYTPRAITDTPLTEKVFPIPASPGAALTCSGCPGEYESVSAAIYALQDLSELRVSASDLTGPAGRIPAEAVDISIVKSWYQAGREISDLTHKAYVPELLLKDDALVRVDPEKEENYVRSTERDGAATYLLCSGPTSENLAGVRPLDARRLQPVAVRAYSLRQFWLTVQIPKKAPAGTYRGAVRFQAASGQQQIPLEVTVHPFDLLPPRLIYSIYYRPSLSLDGPTAINSDVKSEEQYRAEMEDLKAHGVWYPANYQGMDVSGSNQATQSRLRRALQIRQEVGLPGGPFYNVGCGTGATTDPDELAALQQAVKKWLDFCRPFGFTEVYFYGTDEATGEGLIAQRSSWKAVQEAGGKTFVAGSEGTFEAMGKLLNCAVLVGKPDSEEAKKWHSVGSHAFCYAYPQVGNEEPERYRRNFGLVLWKAGFDGAMNYAYQHAFGHIWNDFDSPHYRDHNFTYPTVDGVVGTIQWEGFREAVDDVRYVTTLEQVIATAPEEKKSLARRAQEWLENLNPETADLYETRAAMVEWIKRLKG